MTPAYNRIYLQVAQKGLARMLDFACHGLGYTATDFWRLFLTSGVAVRFGEGESHLLAGMSGFELAYEVLDCAKIDYVRPENPISPAAKSPEYWAGWALARYQWESGRTFEEIDKAVPISSVILMYSPYHEMDISQFVEEMERRLSR